MNTPTTSETQELRVVSMNGWPGGFVIEPVRAIERLHVCSPSWSSHSSATETESMAQRSKVVIAALALLWPCVCWADSPAVVGKAAQVVPQRTELAVGIAHLRDVCTPLWERPPSKCVAALDSVYFHRDVTRNWHSEPLQGPAEGDKRLWGPLPLSDRIVWRDVFDEPMELRSAMEKAMAEPRCRAMPGHAPHGLREACAADALARLSVLHRACGRILYWDGSADHEGWAAEWALERERLAERGPGLGDAQRIARLDESELHFAWRVAKCRAVPSAAMARIIGLRVPHYRLGIQDVELLQVAARLGSVWANTQAGGDGTELNAASDANLGLAYVRRAFGAALGHYDSQDRYLPYLLAAREYDVRTGTRLDWSELEQRFSEATLRRARPALERLLRRGWQPMQERPSTDITWPWTIAPPVVDTQRIRRRLDESGNMRWRYESGTEEWIDGDGVNHILEPDGSESVIIHDGPLRSPQHPSLRSWVDENGRRRWLDIDGVEHWIDDEGAEHWIDFRGTEWILLPPEPPYLE